MNRLLLFKRKNNKKKKLKPKNVLQPSTSHARRHSYTVAPHLKAEFAVPLSAFAATHAEYTGFVVAGFIFSERSSAPAAAAAAAATAAQSAPRMLLLQRAWTDSYGGYWDFPGGSIEPSSDATLLDGVVREVLEETGFHVSRIRELVRVDAWVMNTHMGTRRKVAKYSFIVDVHEAAASSLSAGDEWESASGSESDHDSVVTTQQTLHWEDQVQLAEAEHQRYVWATEEEVEASVVNKRNGRGEEGLYPFVGIQGETALEAFRKYKGFRWD